MLMSAKTPGFNVARLDSVHKPAMYRQQHALHPPLLVNLGVRTSLTDVDGDNSQSSPLLFGPEGSMLFPIDSSNDVQLVDQQEGLTTLLSPAPVSLSPPVVTEAQSLPEVVISDDLSQPNTVSPLIASASGSTTTPSTQSTTSSSTIPNGSSLTSQVGSQSMPQSQIQADFTTSIISSTMRGAASATTPPTLTSAIPSPTTSQALSSSSTSDLQRDVASLPRVAEIVIGIVGAISLIAFLATLGSWIYKQCHRRRQHAEIISIASFGDAPSRGFFGCLKKRNEKHTDDMSELGFGLGRVTFFGEPNSGDDHHRVGLASGAENVVQEAVDETNQTFPVPSNPFADHLDDGYVRRAPTMMRRRQDDEATDAASSISIFPYQHLASVNALGGASATPLKVANVVPGDTNDNDDGGHVKVLRAPSTVTRYPSVGTPRIGVSNPRFMSLIADEALSVPWAPLDIRRSELRSVDENKASSDLEDEERDTGFRQVKLSRAETLTLAVSKSFSQRIGRSFSKTTNWRNVLTRPPPSAFEVARERDNTPLTTSGTEKHWTTTLKNNFYSAWNAVGSSIHGAGPGSHNVDLEAPPVHTTQFIPELTVVPYRSDIKAVMDPVEDIFTPPPARVFSVRLGRTKGSIIRGHLGITAGGDLLEHGTGLGLDLESLSRSSTLSTCWSDNEKDPDEEMVRKVRMRVRGLSRNSRMIQRSDTGSTVSSVKCPAPRDLLHSGRERVGSNVRNMKPLSKRPRISRVPMSQSSVWSSTSYASTNGGEEKQGRIS